jgi:hypothetical protein
MPSQDQTKDQQHHEHPQPGPDVAVTVDTQSKTVHRGSWVVAEFKKEVGVGADRALDEVVGGEFKPLADDQRITIKGGEVFVSHVRQGGSS